MPEPRVPISINISIEENERREKLKKAGHKSIEIFRRGIEFLEAQETKKVAK